MRGFFLVLVLLVLGVAYHQVVDEVWDTRSLVRMQIPAGYTIPSRFSRILAVGNKGLLSDFLFLKTATFIGGRIGGGATLDEEDWHFVIKSLDVITDLDPYFVDPYMLAEGLIAWDAGKPEVANKILAKGAKARSKDWRLPFFIGFNYFYFLKEYDKASSFIMDASRMPGSPGYLATLGARLAYYGGKTKTALLFLQEMLAETNDALMKSRLQKRLVALENAVTIEEAIEKYKAEKNGDIHDLSMLVKKGFLKVLPPEPYGGQWVVMKNGRVFSTSKFTEAPPPKNVR